MPGIKGTPRRGTNHPPSRAAVKLITNDFIECFIESCPTVNNIFARHRVVSARRGEARRGEPSTLKHGGRRRWDRFVAFAGPVLVVIVVDALIATASAAPIASSSVFLASSRAVHCVSRDRTIATLLPTSFFPFFYMVIECSSCVRLLLYVIAERCWRGSRVHFCESEFRYSVDNRTDHGEIETWMDSSSRAMDCYECTVVPLLFDVYMEVENTFKRRSNYFFLYFR